MKNRPLKNHLLYWLSALIPLLLLTGAVQLADPTRPPNALLPPDKSMNSGNSLQVTAIFNFPNSSFAIINGQKVGIGDKIGAYSIINIHNDRVELKGMDDNSLVLTLLPTVKQPEGN